MNSSVKDYLNSGPKLSFGERAASVVGGLMLAAAGTQPRPNMLLNVLAVAAGSYLAYRGATGYCPLKAAIADSGIVDEGRGEIAPGAI